MPSLNDIQCLEDQTVFFPNISIVIDTNAWDLGNMMDYGKSGQDSTELVVHVLLGYKLGIGENSN